MRRPHGARVKDPIEAEALIISGGIEQGNSASGYSDLKGDDRFGPIDEIKRGFMSCGTGGGTTSPQNIREFLYPVTFGAFQASF